MTSSLQIPGYGSIYSAPEQKSPNLDLTALMPSMMVRPLKTKHILNTDKILNMFSHF